MDNTRVFWIAWCSAWALGWFTIGWFTLGLGWLGVPLSLLAILIPVGAPARPQIPPAPSYRQLPPR